MTFERSSLTELKDFYEAEQAAKFDLNTPLLDKSIVKTVAYMFAGGDHMLYNFVTRFVRNAFIDTAIGIFLDRWSAIWKVTRKAADYAKGTCTFTGVSGTLIPLGTTIKRVDGVEFTTDVNGTISAGTVDIAVTATDSGIDGNTAGSSTLTLSSAIAGVDSDVTVNSDGLTGGVDTETDDELRGRLKERIQSPPQGGTAVDFIRWTKEISAITRAWCIEAYAGAGTIGIFAVEDNNPVSIIPGSAKLTEIEEYLETLRPVCCEVQVVAPTTKALDIEVDLAPNTAATQASVQSAIADLVYRDGEPGGTILLSHIQESIITASGVTDYDLISPTANVTHTATQIPIVGTFTFGSL